MGHHLSGTPPSVAREDNQAAIMVVGSGRNPTMRQIGRVQRVDVGWLHECLGVDPNNGSSVNFCGVTGNMSADIYTKSFNSLTAWGHALELINVFRSD